MKLIKLKNKNIKKYNSKIKCVKLIKLSNELHNA